MRLSTQHLHLESAQAPRKPQSKHNARSRPLAVSPDPRPAPSHPHKCHHHPPGCLVSRGLVWAHGRTGALPGFPAPGLHPWPLLPLFLGLPGRTSGSSSAQLVGAAWPGLPHADSAPTSCHGRGRTPPVHRGRPGARMAFPLLLSQVTGHLACDCLPSLECRRPSPHLL